ncbi:hypothetical protein BV20DRAFT_982266 [Pilatotrama ljubarskyi]|nr:hypothetical protein BV20DRAFT_982266 [Pilatotrama ljubarskyi]
MRRSGSFALGVLMRLLRAQGYPNGEEVSIPVAKLLGQSELDSVGHVVESISPPDNLVLLDHACAVQTSSHRLDMFAPLLFIQFTPQPCPTQDVALGCHRDRVRSEMRSKLDGTLAELTGIPHAHMSYTTDTYARLVVIRYGWKLVGWPKSVPFRNFSKVRGGATPFLKLRFLWNGGKLKFIAATREDLANAARDPKTVHPCPAQLEGVTESGDDSEENRNEDDMEEEEAVASAHVAPLVLRPSDLSVIGVHPVSTRPAPSERCRRRQRIDTKRARRRPKTNPENRPPRHPKPGVKSRQCVLSEDEDGGAGPTPKRAKYTATDEPIEEFILGDMTDAASAADTDEIESASGDWPAEHRPAATPSSDPPDLGAAGAENRAAAGARTATIADANSSFLLGVAGFANSSAAAPGFFHLLPLLLPCSPILPPPALVLSIRRQFGPAATYSPSRPPRCCQKFLEDAHAARLHFALLETGGVSSRRSLLLEPLFSSFKQRLGQTTWLQLTSRRLVTSIPDSSAPRTFQTRYLQEHPRGLQRGPGGVGRSGVLVAARGSPRFRCHLNVRPDRDAPFYACQLKLSGSNLELSILLRREKRPFIPVVPNQAANPRELPGTGAAWKVELGGGHCRGAMAPGESIRAPTAGRAWAASLAIRESALRLERCLSACDVHGQVTRRRFEASGGMAYVRGSPQRRTDLKSEFGGSNSRLHVQAGLTNLGYASEHMLGSRGRAHIPPVHPGAGL